MHCDPRPLTHGHERESIDDQGMVGGVPPSEPFGESQRFEGRVGECLIETGGDFLGRRSRDLGRAVTRRPGVSPASPKASLSGGQDRWRRVLSVLPPRASKGGQARPIGTTSRASRMREASDELRCRTRAPATRPRNPDPPSRNAGLGFRKAARSPPVAVRRQVPRRRRPPGLEPGASRPGRQTPGYGLARNEPADGADSTRPREDKTACSASHP